MSEPTEPKLGEDYFKDKDPKPAEEGEENVDRMVKDALIEMTELGKTVSVMAERLRGQDPAVVQSLTTEEKMGILTEEQRLKAIKGTLEKIIKDKHDREF